MLRSSVLVLFDASSRLPVSDRCIPMPESTYSFGMSIYGICNSNVLNHGKPINTPRFSSKFGGFVPAISGGSLGLAIRGNSWLSPVLARWPDLDFCDGLPRRRVLFRVYNLYGYGSIPINTIFRGMNIHLPAILMFTRGTRFWHTAICFLKLFKTCPHWWHVFWVLWIGGRD